jgi:hypothetical protein
VNNLALLVLVTACSSPTARDVLPDADPSPIDAGNSDTGSAGVAPDILISGGGSALTAWDFGPEEAGSASTALALTVTNETGQTSTALVVASPAAFPLDASSSCAQNIELAPGADCSILIRFDPASVGEVSGALSIDGGSTVGSASLALSGSGVAAPDLDTTPSFFDFGVVEFGSAAQTTLSIQNSGPDLVIDSIAIGNPIGAGFSLASTTCMGALAAGSACDIVAQFQPTAFGQNGANLTVQTDHGPYVIGTNWLMGYGGARLTVTMAGSGAGYVASDGGGVPDIDCGTTCSGLFTDGPNHTLTESTADQFNGWGGDGSACGSASSTCAVTLSTGKATIVQATFSPLP